MNLSEAIKIVDHPRLIESILNAGKKTLSYDDRYQAHCDSCKLYEVHEKCFKDEDKRLGEALRKSDKTFAEYEAQKAKRDALPKNHVDREQETLSLGAKWAFAILDAHNAEWYLKDVKETQEALNLLSQVINNNAAELRELGDQQKGYGPKGYFRTDDPLPSFPARPPLHPTNTPLTGSNFETETAWCAWCEQEVKVQHDLSRGKFMPEHHAHLCKDGQYRMLTLKIRMGSDNRPNSSELSKMQKHPHSGTQT